MVLSIGSFQKAAAEQDFENYDVINLAFEDTEDTETYLDGDQDGIQDELEEELEEELENELEGESTSQLDKMRTPNMNMSLILDGKIVPFLP